MKDAELKFVIAVSHAFNPLENDSLLDLVQTAIDIGAQVDKVNVSEIFSGQRTIRKETMVKVQLVFRHDGASSQRVDSKLLHCSHV